jgi:UDP-2-acetamido-2,6-beta-L-arabino-hexul-4-ose reductase
MKILITGADGFIGKNLRVALGRAQGVEVLPSPAATRGRAADLLEGVRDSSSTWPASTARRTRQEFVAGNADFTGRCARLWIRDARARFARSPSCAPPPPRRPRQSLWREQACGPKSMLLRLRRRAPAPRHLPLPNVFGKWSRPNYNSAVATFCHNIARGLPIQHQRPGRAGDAGVCGRRGRRASGSSRPGAVDAAALPDRAGLHDHGGRACAADRGLPRQCAARW